ncbi:hypothetical protein [Thiococcus pfennigii]|uniref:hypothetical protein n=1 Tax=Thiococcus pfennigii TaxID=1057 RepID=UPI001903C269|nr:hypothetical protein [Thiococcus pfennigii]MBK1701981.1 hypothetical protein [Thiococcus pfennigii]MBK1730491.1 hypothetical protein [Thiococcus pfennigii]
MKKTAILLTFFAAIFLLGGTAYADRILPSANAGSLGSDYEGVDVSPGEFADALTAYEVLTKRGAMSPEVLSPSACDGQLLFCTGGFRTCEYECQGTAGGGTLTGDRPCGPVKVCVGLPNCEAVCLNPSAPAPSE